MTARALPSFADAPFHAPAEIVLDLPVPPGTNNLFANSARGGRHKSERYRSWIDHAGWELRAARQKPITGRVAVFMTAPEKASRDLDGYWKPILDLLVAHRLIEGDRCKFVRELHAGWWSTVDLVHVVVRPLSTEESA